MWRLLPRLARLRINEEVVTAGEVFINDADYIKITGSDSQDTIYNSGNNVSISGGLEADTIFNTGDNVSITGGASNDLILIGNSYTRNSDTTITYGSEVSILASSVTINGGAGNDTIWGNRIGDSDSTKAHIYQFGNKDGSDVIYNFGKNDKISLNGTSYSVSISGATKWIEGLVQKQDAENNLLYIIPNGESDTETTDSTRTVATNEKIDGENNLYLIAGGDINNSDDWTTDSTLSDTSQIFTYLDNDGNLINTTDTNIILNNNPVMIDGFVEVDDPTKKDVAIKTGKTKITLKDIEVGRVINFENQKDTSSPTYTVQGS